MRILHLNPFFFPYAGGIERRILEIGRRHARRHEVYVLTSQLDGTAATENMEGLHVERLPSRYRFGKFYNPPLVSTPGLEAAIERIAPDVIDYHFRWAPKYANAYGAARCARVFSYHNTFAEGDGALGLLSWINDRWTKRWIAKSDRIVAPSAFIERNLRDHGFPGDRLAVVPNGVNAETLRAQASPDSMPMRDTIVSVGRAVRVKGFDLLVRALTLLPRPIRLLICGEGPERSRLLRLARDLDVGDRVEAPGWVEEPRKLASMRDCLAYVHAARFEAFGISALEALAMGAPVVAVRTGGLPELVGDAGLLVDPRSPPALAAAIRRLADDPFLRSQLQSHAGARVDCYGWDRAANEMERVYEAAIEDARV